MKIKKVNIKNFRSYKNETDISLKDMNILLGKNDIGKSTILEALDIFFNDGKGSVVMSVDDINNENSDEDIEITVSFSDFDDEITLETIPTSLKGEYLLNKEGYLEIKKIYTGRTMKPKTYIVAEHPNNDDFIQNLLIKKIKDLQKYVNDHKINVSGKQSVSSVLREAIRDSYGELILSKQLIPVDKEDAKKIWDQILITLPVYTLFQSDRSNSDQDNEVQNPMNIALRNILAKPDIQKKLNEVFKEVESEMKEVANGTLDKLDGINSDLANDLSPKLPEFEKLSWNKAFSKTEILSDNIPLNKRGSGVKRMVLLSFFLNEVERRMKEDGLSDVIYAFEEPETSQHPNHQEILVDAFQKLSGQNGVQVILTTHSPYVYKRLTNDKSINLLHIENDFKGNKSIKDIFCTFDLLPYSPSWGEINYHVYSLPTYEFFDELYSRLEELNDLNKHVDNFIQKESLGAIPMNLDWHRLNNIGKTITDKRTYISCIRNKIHHPDNNLNKKFNVDLSPMLEKALIDMIDLIKKINEKNTSLK